MDATFWALVGLVIFLGIAVYAGIPAMLGRALDARGTAVRGELDEAKRLREEAQALLAEYQAKRLEAERDAQAMITAARAEASALAEDARRKSEDFVTRRTAMAEQKIAQAERDALAEVRGRAADLAIDAAGRVMSANVAADGQFRQALDRINTRTN